MPVAKLSSILPALVALLMISSCASNEIGQSRDINQETIYQQYDVDYDETENKVEVMAQFRFAGINGTTLVLNEPSKFECDDEIVKVDSSDFSGAFYKTGFLGKTAMGKHRLLFTDIDKKKYENEFSIEVFRLVDIPAAISKSDSVIISFEAPALQQDDYIELATDNTDSAFTLKHAATDPGNNIIITAEQIKRQKGKSLSLYATLYRKIPLKQQAKEGGLIKISQSTKPVTVKIND